MSERIHLTAAELCDVSGLTLEQWGIDATTKIVVAENFVNGYTADGYDLPDLCAGNDALQRKVWAEASARWGTSELTYRIAFVLESTGGWEVVEEFPAANNDAANAYAEEHYAGREWYVIDADGNNING
jgi:hypothetical protein